MPNNPMFKFCKKGFPYPQSNSSLKYTIRLLLCFVRSRQTQRNGTECLELETHFSNLNCFELDSENTAEKKRCDATGIDVHDTSTNNYIKKKLY